VDVAWLDGTFYSPLELPGRDPAQIPHPCIAQSLSRFAALCAAERAKIHFLHLNHSNPAADFGTAEAAHIRSEGFSVAEEGVRFFLS